MDDGIELEAWHFDRLWRKDWISEAAWWLVKVIVDKDGRLANLLLMERKKIMNFGIPIET
jgi:hypothetical protein